MRKSKKALAIILSSVLCVSLFASTVQAEGLEPVSNPNPITEDKEEIRQEEPEEIVVNESGEIVSEQEISEEENTEEEIEEKSEEETEEKTEEETEKKTEEIIVEDPEEDPEIEDFYDEDIDSPELDFPDELLNNPGDIEISDDNFTDENFRTYVSERCDSDHDGFLSEDEINETERIECVGYEISELTGIGYFTKLKELDCSWNEIKNLDLSDNLSLIEVDCSRNEIENLDVTQNESLEILECDANQLQTLDVSNNPALMQLSCVGNRLNSLDIANNTHLTELDCGGNQIESLDVSGNMELTSLGCGFGIDDTRGNNIANLDVSRHKKLRYLECVSNNMSTLNLTGCDNLEELWCSDNDYESLDLSSNQNLVFLVCSSDNLKELDIRNNTSLETFEFSGENLEKIDVSRNTSLKHFCLTAPKVSELDISKNTELELISVTGTGITELDLSNNPDLVTVGLRSNQLENLDLSNLSKLEELDCDENQLTSLSVSGCPLLTRLECSYNEIAILDTSNNPNLEWIECRWNQIENLDLSNNTNLENLNCEYNNMTSLNVTNCGKLDALSCYANRLTSLDVSHNPLLRLLYCSDNDFESLDIHSNPLLFHLECNFTDIRELDISGNENLLNAYVNGERTKQEYYAVDAITYTVEIPDPYNPEFTTDCYFTFDDGVRIIVDPDAPVEEGIIVDKANFPDKVFRHFISDNVDSDQSSVLSEAEINAVTEMNISQRTVGETRVHDLKGIEFFTSLKKLDCSKNSIMNLDLSSNKQLVSLDCSQNGLQLLNLSDESPLKEIDCSENLLETLVVGEFTSLVKLNCSDNRLEALDVTTNTLLESLNCADNKLDKLNVSNNTNLKELSCYRTDLRQLDISKNEKLLDCYKNGVKTIEEDTSFYGNKNSYTIETKGYRFEYSEITNVRAEERAGIEVDDVNFPDQYFRSNFVSMYADEDNDYFLTEEEIKKVTRCNPFRMPMIYYHISDVKGIEYFTELTEIIIPGNHITQLNLANNKKVQFLYCSNNWLENLNIEENAELLELSCRNNVLTELNIGKNTKLYNLDCAGNQLSRLDISHNPILQNVYKKGVKSVEEQDGKKIVTYRLENVGTLTFDEGVSIITEDGPDKESVVEVFDDIPEKAWFVKAVQYVYDNNIMGGKGASFKPNDPITREEFVRVLYNHAGTPEVTIANPFADVKTGAWYEKSVLWAKEKNIANGKTKDIFGVGQQIRREELARMIYMYAQLQEYDTTKDDTAIDGFSDKGSVSTWAKDAMNWAVSQGVMGGKGGKLDPQGLATRAECASMIKNMIEKTAPKAIVTEK